MKKSISTLSLLMASFLNCMACTSDSPVADGDDDVPTDFEIQYTSAVPSEFFQAATQQGAIELVEYESKDYTSASRPATRKPAYVYVPYGYDPSKQYDVIYLLHGWTGVAEEYFLGRSGSSRTGYSLWGGSAGARMAATLGNSANLRSLTGRTDLPQASVVVMQYTGYTTVSPYDGPTYACCGTSDGIASWRTMQSRLESLSALGIPTEFHAYNGLPHGFGLGTGTIAEGWLQDAVHFWQQQSGATAIRSAKANTKPSDTIYSLNGIRHNSLQPGVNIVDGRKVVILKYSAKRQ